MKNRLSAILMAFFASVSLNALSFSEIRALGKAGEEVALSGVLEGLVVSDYRWTNTETGENIDACIVNLGASLQTAYIQNEDGSLGFRVKFRSIYHPLPTTQEKILHMDITRWSTLKSD